MMRLLGIVLLVGCTADVPGTQGRHEDPGTGSGDTGGGGGGEQTSITLSQYFDKIAAVYCEQAWGCRDTFPPDAGYTFESAWGTSIESCEQALVASWNPAQVETEIAKGRITYDGTAAVSCLQGVTFAACPEYWQRGIEWAESCYHVVVGLVPLGGTCENDYSCETFYCDPPTHTCQ